MKTKVCPKCKTEKDRDQFYGKGKPTGWCKECSKARSKAYYEANREDQLEAHRRWVQNNKDSVAFHKAKSAYGITREEWDAMPSECAICGSTEKLRIDHCHRTEKYRGRLCDFCNKGLGFFRDDPERLKSAVDYLSKEEIEVP